MSREQHFRDQHSGTPFRLLEPVDAVVNYSFEYGQVDPWYLELTASKWWLDDAGKVVGQQVSLDLYDTESPSARDEAQEDLESLLGTYAKDGLQAAMQQAEQMAVRGSSIEADRADGRLFTDGPPDRFVTKRELELRQPPAPDVDIGR